MFLPDVYNILYKYPLINIVYVVDPSGNFNLKSQWHIFIHIHAWILLYMCKKNQTLFLSILQFVSQYYLFLAVIIAKHLTFSTIDNFYQTVLIKKLSCHLLQVYCCQNIIFCLIMKIHVMRHKQILLLFHLFGVMFTWWGLMKITGNACGVIQVSK